MWPVLIPASAKRISQIGVLPLVSLYCPLNLANHLHLVHNKKSLCYGETQVLVGTTQPQLAELLECRTAVGWLSPVRVNFNDTQNHRRILGSLHLGVNFISSLCNVCTSSLSQVPSCPDLTPDTHGQKADS